MSQVDRQQAFGRSGCARGLTPDRDRGDEDPRLARTGLPARRPGRNLEWLLSHVGSHSFRVFWCSWLRRKHNKSARKLDEQLAHLSKHFADGQALAITSEHIDRYADDRITQNT
jgi:hypothetical protein